ncbi:MAG: nuclear transport factor 2 family protein [Solirubrobacteraceae bacterium]
MTSGTESPLPSRATSSATIVRDMYQSAIDGDFEKFLSYVEDDFELEEPPFLPYGGTYNGRDGFQALFAKATELLDFPTLAIDYVFGEGERACAVISCNLKTSGERRTILEEWIVRDGKVRWGRVYWFNPTVH